MPTSLHSSLTDLAESFAASIIAAIRGASLDELISSNGQAPSKGRPPRAVSTRVGVPPANRSSGSAERLQRRSSEDIAAALGQVVSLVKKYKEGLRAEQIRSELGLQPKEMPRILKEGLEKKALKSKGQKRATTYFAS
jgi:hypothetical protein